jgi:hypothetical protein
MPAIKSLTVNDGESTPVAHTFEPRTADSGVAVFREIGSTWIGDNTLTILTKEAKTNVKVRIVIGMPVVQTETINGIDSPKAVRSAYAATEFTFDKSSSAGERANLRTILGNLLLSGDSDIETVLDGNGIFY